MNPSSTDYQQLRFAYARHADQSAAEPTRHPVVVVGAGPVGLALAIDLAQQGVPVVLLDNDCLLSTGSRAICFAKRTLEVFDRLGCGERMMAKGVSWSVGKVFFQNELVYRFDLQVQNGHARPAFINLQQYYVEGYLAERALALPLIDIRWQNEVVGIEQRADHALLNVDTPDGPYTLRADHVAACDGSRSSARQLVGQKTQGRVFRDRFLIADVRMKLDHPAERWFWFDPAFHPNQSVLLHKQPDGVWRIDFQLGWDADPEEEKQPHRIIPRVKALLASSAMRDAEFELEWASVYTFACRRMPRFRVGRVLFAGDAAHGVSPFGARGANSGVQDAENLAWKLAHVVQGTAPDALLDTYADEREFAADENIRHSSRATDFITPKSEISLLFRNAVLSLARHHPFARTLVNSGRLSVPAVLHASALNTPDADDFGNSPELGSVAADARLRRSDGASDWLLHHLGGSFTALVYGDAAGHLETMVRHAAAGTVAIGIASVVPPGAECKPAQLMDVEGMVAQRYGVHPGSVVLIRPDQHVCARWRAPTPGAVRAALRRALAFSQAPELA